MTRFAILLLALVPFLVACSGDRSSPETAQPASDFTWTKQDSGFAARRSS